MKDQPSASPSSVVVEVDIRDLHSAAGRLDKRAAVKAALATHFYHLQAVPKAASIIWDDAHHGLRPFNLHDDKGKRVIFEALTFTHYHTVIRALVHKEAVAQWQTDGSTPADFVSAAEAVLKVFFDREGMTRVIDFEGIAQSDGWLDPDATLSFDRRISTYLDSGSPESADAYFIGYLEPALACGTLSPTQQVEYRKLFHLVAAGVDAIVDPAPRDLLMLSLSIGPDTTGEAIVGAVKTMFASETSTVDAKTETLAPSAVPPPAPIAGCSLDERVFKVLVDDNFHYMDEDERYELGEFPTLEAALIACKRLVDDFLVSSYEQGMTAQKLLSDYKAFGEDPWIATGDGKCLFSAWDYATGRCDEICGR